MYMYAKSNSNELDRPLKQQCLTNATKEPSTQRHHCRTLEP